MEPERSKPLHNFSFPCLKWGNQRTLRCVNENNSNNNNNNPSLKNNESIDVVRQRIMGDLKIAAKKLKVSIFEENGAVNDVTNVNAHVGHVGNNVVANDVVGNGDSNAVRPWNLRTRRAACKAPLVPAMPSSVPVVKDEGRRFFDVGCSSPSSPLMMKKKKMVNENEKVKFSVSLSKEEVEEDFWALVGTRPPRRPKKRSRIVQRQLNTLLPGMWLSEVTADSYKVSEVPE